MHILILLINFEMMVQEQYTGIFLYTYVRIHLCRHLCSHISLYYISCVCVCDIDCIVQDFIQSSLNCVLTTLFGYILPF